MRLIKPHTPPQGELGSSGYPEIASQIFGIYTSLGGQILINGNNQQTQIAAKLNVLLIVTSVLRS